jgi:hypothetical protein
MKYLCLGYHDPKAWEAIPQNERDAIREECTAYAEQLRRSGHVIDAAALDLAAASTTLRFDDGKVFITDGPFTETKEHLGGVIVLEANDLNHAIQLMSQVPTMRIGGRLEIRPVNEDNHSTRRTA